MRTALALVCLIAGGCVSPPEPPPVPPGPAEVRAAFARLGPAPQALAAHVALRLLAAERDAAAEATVLYRAPGSLRICASVDLVMASRPLFDLALDPRAGYVLELSQGETTTRDRGSLAALPLRHPSFARLFWVREALFLPGSGVAPDAPVEGGPDGYRVDSVLASGARARWTLDPRSLEVRSAEVQAEGERFVLAYSDYRRFGSRWFPHRVELDDPGRAERVTAVVAELELDPEFPPRAFAPEGP